MIEDSLKNRKHVVHYDIDNIPTEQEVTEILQTAYSLVTSKQKGYPYRVHVLGPNKERSREIWSLCEGNKIDTDVRALGPIDERYRANPGLFHMDSAPWTLIYTPRLAPANPYMRKAYDDSNSLWELDDPAFINRNNRESMAIEIGMLAKAITGAVLDRGWDTSYNICFPKDMEKWENFPYLLYYPTLIQTIGKGKVYRWQTLTPIERELNTDPPFEDIFYFADKN